MPTYVAQPQTSRTGLITTIVILCVLTIGMTVLFFVKDNEARKTQIDFDAFRGKYADAVSTAALASPDYQELRTEAKKLKVPSVFDMQEQQKRDLETAIAGSAVPDATDRAQLAGKQNDTLLKKYAGEAQITAPASNSLVDGFRPWPGIADRLIAQREDLKNQLAAAKKANDEALAAHQAALAEKDKQIADATKQIADAQAQIAKLQTTQTENLTQVKTGADKSIVDLTKERTDLQGQVAQLNTSLTGLTKERDNLLLVLRRFKANNSPKEDIIRVPDGVITTVSGTDCFINLGQGDQIYKGMTFEVYDPNKGIPALNDGTSSALFVPKAAGAGTTPAGVAAIAAASRRNADRYQFEMPKGKGSIEVIAVGLNHQSTCRIIHQEEGQNIGQGDLIGNLVYDRNIKYNFVVYGDFDLSGNNNANSRANDAPVMRRLIEQWGGTVQPIADPAKPADAVNATTDFLIVGREPFIPNFTPEEAADPANAMILDKAKAKSAAYQSVLTKAGELGIPVLNQNRFLYYVGYYDQARR